MTTALVSALAGIPVRADVAMTGEITLRGEVTAIGGLKEKLLAAHRGGVKTVLIPEENVKDLQDIPENAKNQPRDRAGEAGSTRCWRSRWSACRSRCRKTRKRSSPSCRPPRPSRAAPVAAGDERAAALTRRRLLALAARLAPPENWHILRGSTIARQKREAFEKTCGISSVGRAIPCQGIGREFEPLIPLQISQRQGSFGFPSFWLRMHSLAVVGAIAKRLCNGLQIRLVRFDSGSRLQLASWPWPRPRGGPWRAGICAEPT